MLNLVQSLKKSENNISWSIRARGEQDITVAFLEKDKDTRLIEPFILFIPKQFVTQKNTISVAKNGDYFKMFQVKEKDLIKQLEEYAELKKNNLI